MGYVGLPVALGFSKKYPVIGFDIDESRVNELRSGIDRNGDCHEFKNLKTPPLFTSHASDLAEANCYIVTVPTPLLDDHKPDLKALCRASEIVGSILKTGDVVVYESTVYPGLTEEICLPILEEVSGLNVGQNFYLGYSPERINPGDNEHRFERNSKIVAGWNEETSFFVKELYESVIDAPVKSVSNIKTAEAAKIIENTQRDLNIALMNELSLICDRLQIDTKEVIDAASTKWNFHPYMPGLVGGHCIGVDPYYLTYKAEKLGYIPEVILAGRRINDSMGQFVARKTIKELIRKGFNTQHSLVTVLGVTFKEDCSDARNSQVFKMIREFQDFGLPIQVCDPVADAEWVKQHHGVDLVSIESLQPTTALVVVVGHRCFREFSVERLSQLCVNDGVVIDVKSLYDLHQLKDKGLTVWRL